MKKVLYLIAVLGTMFAISRIVAEPYRISGDCMEPEYKDGDMHFLNNLPSYVGGFNIGDVVLYKHEGKVWISRIVATGGDIIRILDGEIHINGGPIREPAGIQRSWPGWNYGTYALNEDMKVPDGRYYMLSDKLSAQHDDSRVFGAIPAGDVLGRVWSL